MFASHLACPRCRGGLFLVPQALRCSACSAEYPVVTGIPDLRVAADPWIDMVADRAKGLAVDTQAAPGLEAAVRAYWAMTPDTPSRDAARHIEHVLHGLERTSEWVVHLQPTPVAGENWLDLGCGTADLACAAPADVNVTGIDIAFRWLTIARRRLREAEREAELFCGNAEALPFESESFDRVVALGTIEHCQELDLVLSEARRVLRPGGRLHLRTTNRFTLLPEPHVGIWGVGWMPRAWADRYVRLRGGNGYQHHWPHGAGELAQALTRAGFTQTSVRAARMLMAERKRLPRLLAPLLPGYDFLRSMPVTGQLCRTVTPMLDAQGVAP